jgi:methyl-accepting chemotaxis protein
LDGSGAEPGLSRLSAALGTAAQDARSAAESTRALLPAAAAAGALKPGCGGNGRKAHEASLARIESYMNASSAGLRRAHRAVKGLISGTSEGPAASPSPCHPAAGSVFTSFVTSTAGTIGVLFEEALRDRRITPKALFDANYVKVPGTEPEQYLTGFTVLAHQLLPPHIEGALYLDPRVAYCAATDAGGYFPVHNRKYSLPPHGDRAWDHANCRNRRIYTDRASQKAARSTAQVLMQVLREENSDGSFALIQDLAAPIRVFGSHWGALRLGIRLA